MKNQYVNLNILNERCNGRDNIKEHCSFVSIVVSSEKNDWLMRRENNLKDINL